VEGYRFTVQHRVAWRDLDALKHVNNAVYATYFETARLDYLAKLAGGIDQVYGLILAEVLITFRSPAEYGQALEIGARTTSIGNSSMVIEHLIEDATSGQVVATGRSVMVHYDYDSKRSLPIPAGWRTAIAEFEGRTY